MTPDALQGTLPVEFPQSRQADRSSHSDHNGYDDPEDRVCIHRTLSSTQTGAAAVISQSSLGEGCVRR